MEIRDISPERTCPLASARDIRFPLTDPMFPVKEPTLPSQEGNFPVEETTSDLLQGNFPLKDPGKEYFFGKIVSKRGNVPCQRGNAGPFTGNIPSAIEKFECGRGNERYHSCIAFQYSLLRVHSDQMFNLKRGKIEFRRRGLDQVVYLRGGIVFQGIGYEFHRFLKVLIAHLGSPFGQIILWS
jgi:hypothetical protein